MSSKFGKARNVGEVLMFAKKKREKRIPAASSSEAVHGSENWPELKWQKVEEQKKTEGEKKEPS